MNTVTVNDTTIAYQDVGSGAVLLLIHGGLISHREWQPQIEPFARTLRVIVPDVRGHGASGRDGMPYSIHQWAADMVALLDALGIERAIVCGHSMGGTVAQQMAADHPARVRALIIAESNFGVANEPMMRFAAGISTALFKLMGAKTAVRIATSSLAATPGIKALAGGDIEAHAENPANLFAILDAMNDYDGRENLTRITCPTLIMAGEKFKLSHKQAREMAATIPNAKLVFIPDAGHGANWDNTEAFNREVLSFVESLP